MKGRVFAVVYDADDLRRDRGLFMELARRLRRSGKRAVVDPRGPNADGITRTLTVRDCVRLARRENRRLVRELRRDRALVDLVELV